MRILWHSVQLTWNSVDLRRKYTRQTQDGRKRPIICPQPDPCPPFPISLYKILFWYWQQVRLFLNIMYQYIFYFFFFCVLLFRGFANVSIAYFPVFVDWIYSHIFNCSTIYFFGLFVLSLPYPKGMVELVILFAFFPYVQFDWNML